MARMRRVLRWSLVIVFGLFLIAQFIRPARTNPAIDHALAFESHLQLEPQMAAILDRSCADCHSNKTRWPWYGNVAPVSWFVIDHVNHGRSHLNFSEWGKYDRSKQLDHLAAICELVREDAMPLSSYRPLHPEAKLTEADVQAICEWANAERARLGH